MSAGMPSQFEETIVPLVAIRENNVPRGEQRNEY